VAIRSLCVTEAADRPTIATFIGMREAGIEVTVVCPANHPNHKTLEEAGVPTVDIRLPTNFNKEGIAALRAELIRGRYHIMHTFNNKAVSNGLRACKGLPVKIVCYRGIVGAVGFLDPMSWMRYLNPRIDRIVCVCDAIRRHFLEMKPAFLRMPAERPVTIYKGHKLEWFTATPARLEDYGIPEDAFVVACTANYRPRKGIDYLIGGIELLPSDIPAHLLLIGHMEAEKLTRRIEKSPARERIHRIGWVPNAPELSAASDELVVDGVSGVVVPPRNAQGIADAIETLYRDERLRQRMGEAARARIETAFRNEDTVRNTIALYQELVPDPD
jgi:glycosyltransferase involved in cell wall biosynthesis